MTPSIELPAPLQEELAQEAERVGVTVSEQAVFFLQLMTALTREGRKTPFRKAVQAYLHQNSFDAERLAIVFEKLVAFCLNKSDQQFLTAGPKFSELTGGSDHEEIANLFREWKSPTTHRSLEHEVEPVMDNSGPQGDQVPITDRTIRPSIRGKYAHIKLSTYDFMAEKQLEIEREDRPR